MDLLFLDYDAKLVFLSIFSYERSKILVDICQEGKRDDNKEVTK